MIVPLGQPVDLTLNTFSDAEHTTPADPTAIILTITKPDGTTETHNWPGDITRLALGQFKYTFPATTGGGYTAHWGATGTVTTSEDQTFVVLDRALYLDPADLRTTLAGSTDTSGTAATLSDDDLYDAIWEAQAEVDGRLGERFNTPFTNPPALVVNITRDIAAYLATLTYRRGEAIGQTEPIQLRYARAETMLQQAAIGVLMLTVPGSDPTETVGGGSEAVVVNPTSGPLWTERDFALTQTPSGVDSLTTWPIWPRP